MCSKTIPGSGRKKIVVWTVDPPFKKGNPGFVARSATGPYDAAPTFTDDIWYAWVFESRSDVDTKLSLWKMNTKSTLYTHEAVASLVVPK